MTLKQLEDNLDTGELQHWLAYFSRRIFSWDAGWLQHGANLRTLATIYGPKGQRPPPITEFIPDMSFGGGRG